MSLVFRFLGSLLLTFFAASIGGYGSIVAKGFYATLNRPAWAPPAWLFGPVWLCLYGMISLAGFLAWQSGRARPRDFAVYVSQLALNALWPWLFFVWTSGVWSFAGIVLLWGVILLNVVFFWRCSRVASLLLVPYLLWVSFAAALTWACWQLNPGIL